MGLWLCRLSVPPLPNPKCTDENQTCYDPTPLPNHTDDWRCECHSPSQSIKVMGAVASCERGDQQRRLLQQCPPRGDVQGVRESNPCSLISTSGPLKHELKDGLFPWILLPLRIKASHGTNIRCALPNSWWRANMMHGLSVNDDSYD